MFAAEFDGKYCAIVGRIDNKVMASGMVINHKDVPVKCISFDNKFFFSLRPNLLYYVQVVDSANNVPFNSDGVNVIPWNRASVNQRALIFRENDITELDKEMVDLVEALNMVPGIRTVSSCSGHNKKHAYVDCSFTDFGSLKLLLYVLSSDQFNDKFVLSTAKNLVSNSHSAEIQLRLHTTSIGKEAYAHITELAIHLLKLAK